MKAKIIKTDGTESEVELTIGGWVRELEPILGADTFDTVNLRDERGRITGYVMIVDDNGYEPGAVTEEEGTVLGKPGTIITMHTGPARKPVNEKATALYMMGKMPHDHKIVGDVAILKDSDLAEDDED